MRRLSITLFSLCLASALTAQTTGSNQSVRLRADNIDEVVSAMTLEEKVHLVIGCGMSMGSDTKFPGTAGRTYDIPRLCKSWAQRRWMIFRKCYYNILKIMKASLH